jgi:luciferase family oxidoreductase group 1
VLIKDQRITNWKKPELSVLDLCPLLSGQDATFTFSESVKLARFAEKSGFKRYWLAEHHNMDGIGSSAPEVLISHIASATTKIRVGSGGIMLPNHATLHMAEIFKTLEALHPGRIDFGVGRAPGSGSKAAQLLRGGRGLSPEDFPREFDQIIQWFQDKEFDHYVAAIPTGVTMPEVWVLGSSDFGAQFAANRGFPYSFAQHFSHLPALEILRLYHEEFSPSAFCAKPRAMMGCHIICADTDEEAETLALSSDLSFALFIGTGKSVPLPTVEEARAYPFTAKDWEEVKKGSMPKLVGSPDKIRKFLKPFLQSGLIDELMILCMVHDQEARRKSYQLVKEIIDSLAL